jgi:hypothetical protein
MSTYKTTVTGNDVKITLAKTDHTLSLSRTGGQGAKGDSVGTITINSSNELVVTIVNGAGQTIETINAGSVFSNSSLAQLADVTLTTLANGDVILYDSSSSTFKNYSLTTSRLTDIDNSGKSDGAVLVYDNALGKYISTNQLNNGNTFLIGGSY